MTSFKDGKGRVWEVLVTVAHVKRVRSLLGIDLLALVKDGLKPLGELLSDPCKFVDVLYVLCMDEAKKQSISDEDFGRLMAGDVLEEATTSFLEATCDFFPDARLRASLRETFAKGRKVRDLAASQLAKETAALNPETILADLLRRERLTLNNSATSLPASAELTPAR